MTDTDPLAPIEALLDANEARLHRSGAASYTGIGNTALSAALAEAREAVDRFLKSGTLPVLDGLQEIGHALGLPLGEQITGPAALEAINALVAERDAYRRAKQENDERFMLLRDEARAERDAAWQAVDAVIAERDAAQAKVAESRALPCDGGCVEAPEEDCSRHGRTPADLWRIIDEVRAERDAALAKVQEVARARNYAMRERDEERQAKEGNIAALNAVSAERDAAREALARVEALADDWTRSYPSLVIGPQLRAALTQPATDEEAGQ